VGADEERDRHVHPQQRQSGHRSRSQHFLYGILACYMITGCIVAIAIL